MKIIVNGWDLATNPSVVTSLFALEWLNSLADSNPEIDLRLAVPTTASNLHIVDRIGMDELKLSMSTWDQIRFEQRHLHRFALDKGVALLVFPTGGAPLRSPMPVLTFPPESGGSTDRSLLGRLAWALGNTGTAEASTRLSVLEPNLPPSELAGWVELPAWVSEDFNPLKQTDDQERLSNYSLPPGYVLSFVSERDCLVRLLEVWRWVVDSVDDDQPLVIAGLHKQDLEFFASLIQKLEMEDAVTVVRGITLRDLPVIYRHAACYFHACRSSFGQELRWAMAAGVPVVGIETPSASKILREAGYLAPPDDVRGLAAACITLLVESTVAEQQRQKGLTIARHYHQAHFLEGLIQTLIKAAQL